MYKPMYEGILRDGKLEFRPPMRVWECRDETLPTGNTVFYNLFHNVTFATDDTINTLLYEYYERWYVVYPDWAKMHNELTEQITSNGDYWERLYQSMLLKYDPISNYDMTETEEVTRCGEARSAGNSQQQATGQSDMGQYGYNETSPTATGKENNRSQQTTTTNSNDKTRQNEKRELARKGNIGVVDASTLLEKYREVQLKILDMYIKSFDNLFMVL